MDLLVECGICDANVGVWSLILQFCVDLGSKLLPVNKESDQLLLLFFYFFLFPREILFEKKKQINKR